MKTRKEILTEIQLLILDRWKNDLGLMRILKEIEVDKAFDIMDEIVTRQQKVMDIIDEEILKDDIIVHTKKCKFHTSSPSKEFSDMSEEERVELCERIEEKLDGFGSV